MRSISGVADWLQGSALTVCSSRVPVSTKIEYDNVNKGPTGTSIWQHSSFQIRVGSNIIL